MFNFYPNTSNVETLVLLVSYLVWLLKEISPVAHSSSTSTTEADYMAAVEAGKEIAWMRNILSEFGYGFQESSIKVLSQSPRILNIMVA